MATPRAATRAAPAAERPARIAERLLRSFGDGRTGVVLLAAVGSANVVAALLPDGAVLLDGVWYAALLAVLALSGVAAVAVRAPAAWREWQRPGPVHPGRGSVETVVADRTVAELMGAISTAGYRARLEEARGTWAIHAVRRGWSRFGALASHLAVVVIVLGVAIGAGFGSEITFSLLPGDQALVDAPRDGFSSAVRLESLDAEFDSDGRPGRLDTAVTFLRDGEPVREATLRVNEPGDFDGYLVHPWTYGPAARIRVTSLGGATLLDASVPLDAVNDGAPVGTAELPTAGVTLGLSLTDADANELGVSAVGGSGLIDSVHLRPGEASRVGDVLVVLDGFDAWVTFMSRRDPGLPIVFGGAALLCASLAVGLWLPRRRLTIRPVDDGLRLVLRGERFDRPADELARVAHRLAALR
ncbi:MAG TPA: cytochrome c biogenesis protein ResB [Candidatus Limnocylindria bacterium]|nr:cytochrome c biogenesis protein ResB [Candidatus Limnocylindria bacterium]